MAAQPQLTPQKAVPSLASHQMVVDVAEPSPEAYDREGASRINPLVIRLPIEVDVAIPIRKFRVRNLLALSVGTVIPSQWRQGEDMPLAARGAQLAWAEFEVVDQKLAVRITRLV
jgi:flagellar motor switch protein FliN/FliY